MNTKILLLTLMFVLLIPLHIAADNLAANEKREIKTSSVIVTISTTSEWSRVSFNGASIKDYKVLDRTKDLKELIIDPTGIIINKFKDDGSPDAIRLKLKLGIFDNKVELVTTKTYSGEVNVNIDEVGEYKNNKKPLQVPITIETTSDWAKVGLNGVTIRDAKILDIEGTTLREPIIGTESIILAKLEANDTSYGSAKFSVDLSLDTPMPVVTLEKADNGITKVSIGGLILENNGTAVKSFKNIPLIVETTSNKTEINFEGIYFSKAKPVDIDKQSLIESIVGSNFIFLNYSHSGNNYRKASYLIDFGITATPTNITIMKNYPGYTVVNFATYDFASIGRREGNKSVTYSINTTAVREPLFEPDKIKEDKYEVTLPLRIETTSDWTEVALRDVTITSAEIKSTSGNIERPSTGTNTILLKKPKSYDNSFASVDFLLHIDLNEKFKDLRKDTVTMTLAKGDIGTTAVYAGKMEGLVNAENIKNDPRNTKTYEISLTAMQSEKMNEENISYNPVIYSVPLFNELYRQNIELADTQEMSKTYAISADTLPGRYKINFNLRKSEALGLLSGVILSYLILIILGISFLSKEGLFDFVYRLLGEDKTTVHTTGVFVIKLFEKTPASSLFIFEALIALTITPFLLILNRTYAEGTAVFAYFLLASGIGLYLVGKMNFAEKMSQWFEMRIIMFIVKIESIVLALSIAIAIGYDLIGFYGALIVLVPTLVFMMFIIKYIKQYFPHADYTGKW